MVLAYRIMTDGGSQKIRRDELGALMDQLVKRMLAVGAGFSPDDGTGLIRQPGGRYGPRTCRCSPCCPVESRPESGACIGRKAG